MENVGRIIRAEHHAAFNNHALWDVPQSHFWWKKLAYPLIDFFTAFEQEQSSTIADVL